jgi:hypothetical protein
MSEIFEEWLWKRKMEKMHWFCCSYIIIWSDNIGFWKL